VTPDPTTTHHQQHKQTLNMVRLVEEALSDIAEFKKESLARLMEVKDELSNQNDAIRVIKERLESGFDDQTSEMSSNISTQLSSWRASLMDKFQSLGAQAGDLTPISNPDFGLYSLSSVELWLMAGCVLLAFYIINRAVSTLVISPGV
jgi:hypothetical protein